jgi:hypothetical protein
MATTKSGTATAREGADGAASAMSADFGEMDEQLRAFVKERPVLALLSAVAAGYLVGRLLRRVA